jgi:hypothetical protein
MAANIDERFPRIESRQADAEKPSARQGRKERKQLDQVG